MHKDYFGHYCLRLIPEIIVPMGKTLDFGGVLSFIDYKIFSRYLMPVSAMVGVDMIIYENPYIGGEPNDY